MARSRLENPDAVLFDLDGTLVDTLPLFVRAYSASAMRVGLKIPPKEIPFLCFGKTEEEICGRFGRPELAGALRREYFREVRRTIISSARPVPGADELLDFLGERTKLAVVSFAYGWYVGKILNACGLSRHFSKRAVFSRDAVRRQKPFPDQALLACKVLGADPEFSAVVGDSPSDIGMAESAGCFSILYRPNGYSRYFGPLKQFVPNERVKSLSALKKIIRFDS